METSSQYYLTKLTNEFCKRQRANPSYSLRAFARFLQIDSSTLVAVLKKKRPLPLKKAKIFATKLGLSPDERQLFYNSVFLNRIGTGQLAHPALKDDAQVISEQHHFQVISEWEHFAMLNLIELAGTRSEPAWLAKRLGISEIRAQTVVTNLLATKLMRIDENHQYRRTTNRLKTSEDVASASLRKGHKEMVEISVRKLEEVEVKLRNFSTCTMKVNLERIEEAKALIRSFERKFSALVGREDTTEVYELSIQFFPLTQPFNPPARTETNEKR